ncbi:2-C-methyl-D-erythritol 2,4-cyclodiphosphate synthase domain protein [Mycobacterium avium MAV_061107_1842]|nr:2-C-methyl-D-erythritol 2,4-cyclodiphosphate synthase domain protein [Mycobacterium avium MAV_061107_1842]
MHPIQPGAVPAAGPAFRRRRRLRRPLRRRRGAHALCDAVLSRRDWVTWVRVRRRRSALGGVSGADMLRHVADLTARHGFRVATPPSR